jgi:Mg2+-importing ATPase
VELVPGDIVRLTAGDLLSSRDFFVNQALPTGESYPIEKHTANRGDPAPEIREANVALAGTSVISEKRESSDLQDRTANTAPSIGHISPARRRQVFRDRRSPIQHAAASHVVLVVLVTADSMAFDRLWIDSVFMSIASGITGIVVGVLASKAISLSWAGKRRFLSWRLERDSCSQLA